MPKDRQEQIQDMFREFGLGQESERNYFKAILHRYDFGVAHNDSTSEERLGFPTTQEEGNAELESDT